MISEYSKSKNKTKSKKLWDIVEKITKTVQKQLEKDLLKSNSKEQENKIINSFLDNNVIQVIWWKQITEETNRVNFVVNMENLSIFLNEVSSIIWSDNDFDYSKNSMKNLIINWYLDIKNNLIIDSDIGIELPVSSINKDTNEQQSEIIIRKIKFKWLDLENINTAMEHIIFSKSTPENKIIVTAKLLIK